MMACEERAAAVRVRRVSLVLPVLPGGSLSAASLAEYRELLEADGAYDSVEVIVAGHDGDSQGAASWIETGAGEEERSAIYVASEAAGLVVDRSGRAGRGHG